MLCAHFAFGLLAYGLIAYVAFLSIRTTQPQLFAAVVV